MSDTRYEHRHASQVAEILMAYLRPACSQIQVAGSLRRMKPDVGDIELLYIPKISERPGQDMFRLDRVNEADEVIEDLLMFELLKKRLNKNEGANWGAFNKLAVDVGSGIPVDLFATSEAAWFNYLVCRTGPADSNTEICTRAIRKGWKWNPYGEGFTNQRTGEVHAVQSEREVFEFVGMEYREPQDRK